MKVGDRVEVLDCVSKMREEFEAAIVAEMNSEGHTNPCTVEEMVADRNGDLYYSHINSGAWWAWQASREALVIQLPRIVGYEGAYDSCADNEFCPRHSDVQDADEVFGLCRSIEVLEAIEAAGMKVKL